ncbi:MAG TPA: hypothetical protein VHV82_14135 [Sporichthyaceae bacterium]|jgi:hypothetical protein|nr:hypothetical protein [Sporichthyaceae bacterium]
MNRRRLLAAVMATPVVVLAPTQAWAWFSVGPTSVNGSAKADLLGKPSITVSRELQILPLLPKIADTITVTAAPTSGPTPAGYVVYRTTGNSNTQVCTITTVPGHCTVAGDLLGDTYAVYSYLGSHWVSATAAAASTGLLPLGSGAGSTSISTGSTTGSSTGSTTGSSSGGSTAGGTSVPATPDGFAASTDKSSVVAGTKLTVNLTATSNSSPDTTFNGTVPISNISAAGSPGGASPSGATATASASSVTFVNGVASFDITLIDAATGDLTLGVNGVTLSIGGFTVTPAALSSLTLSGPATATVGTTSSAFTLKAADAFGNAVTGVQTIAWAGAASDGSTNPTYPATSVTFDSTGTATGLTASFVKAETVHLRATAAGITSNAVDVTVS